MTRWSLLLQTPSSSYTTSWDSTSEDSTPDRKRQIKHMTRTRRLLENLSSRQVQIVNKVLERSPEAAQPALARALRNLEAANQAVARAIDQAIVLAGHQEREKRQREQGKPKVHNLPKDVKPTIDDIAAALDLTKDALLDLLSQDAALAQIVHESGLDTEAFRQNVVAIVVERLQALVEEGNLTQDALELIAEELQDRIDSLIEEVFTDDDDARPDLPFSIGDLATILEIEPSRLHSLLRGGNSILNIAGRRGINRDRLIETLTRLARQRLQGLVADGAIHRKDLAQLLADIENKIKNHIASSFEKGDKPTRVKPDRVDRPKIAVVPNAPFDLKLVARILGVSEEALLARLKQGGTLAQIAEESGVTLDDVVEKLAAAMKKKLSKLIEADKLEPNQARRLLDEVVKRLTQSLREFRQATIDKAKTNGRPAWASSARLYKDIPKTEPAHWVYPRNSCRNCYIAMAEFGLS